MNNMNWEKLRILSVALDSRSLSEAARRLGVSQPTVSRQIRALEADFGETLIVATAQGVFPTAAGARLAPMLDEMKRAAEAVVGRSVAPGETHAIRVSCGPWLAAFLARNIDALAGDPADMRWEIVSSIAFADLPRREADIAIRNQRPEAGRLLIRRLPDYACAVYGANKLVKGKEEAHDDRRYSAFEWAALIPELEHFPTARWLCERLQASPIVRFSSSVNLLDAVKGASVLAVLPCFAGDAESELVRLSEPFIPDYGGHWLVLADDARRRPYVRCAADRIVDFMKKRKKALLPGSG